MTTPHNTPGNIPDAPSTVDERAARLQARLDAVAAAAARTAARQPVATGQDWARLEQRLHSDQQRHRRTRVGLISAAAACAVVTAGLSWSHLNGAGPSVRVVPATVPSQTTDPGTRPFEASLQGEIIVASEEDGVHQTAALQGPLSRVGSCIGVRGTLVIWPAGTTWDASTTTLTLPDGSTSQLGEEMLIGGGNSTAQTAGLSQQAAQALTDCGVFPDQDIWIV
ncbi:hypothetical protein [Kineococcus sp. NPDC059986]|uniref:hypothetical protein n=1 Tax=Kineococcus sp. NPDC059986 TaxID=3155538 RepID=UPI0034509C95